jgi:hypothetical protein
MLAILAYVIATILSIREIYKKEKFTALPVWLIMTGLVSTFMLFLFSMCIVTATTFYALSYLYTAPAYMLLLIFYGISLCWGLEVFFGIVKKRRLGNAPLN